ncbi:MAG TPA: hypothetical protein VI751_06380 [Actinomycetota bacterium]
MRQLFPTSLDPVDPAGVYGDPPLAGPGGRPGARLSMIASVDGATTIARVSGGLGGSADHDLFLLLRSLAAAPPEALAHPQLPPLPPGARTLDSRPWIHACTATWPAGGRCCRRRPPMPRRRRSTGGC